MSKLSKTSDKLYKINCKARPEYTKKKEDLATVPGSQVHTKQVCAGVNNTRQSCTVHATKLKQKFSNTEQETSNTGII